MHRWQHARTGWGKLLPPELPPPPARFAEQSSSTVDSKFSKNTEPAAATSAREERAALQAQMETMLQQMALLKSELAETREGSVRTS